MIIADLIDHSSREWIGRVYLSGTPFPGDTVEGGDSSMMVVRRSFLDLGPEATDTDRTISLKLNVRPL